MVRLAPARLTSNFSSRRCGVWTRIQWPGTGRNACDRVQRCWARRCRASLEVGLVLLPSFTPALSVLLSLVLRPGVSCACVSQRAASATTWQAPYAITLVCPDLSLTAGRRAHARRRAPAGHDVRSVSSASKAVACPETTCATRPVRCPCTTAVSARNCTTKARVTDKCAGRSAGGSRLYSWGPGVCRCATLAR
jgi:hypothetical protein